MKFKYQFFLDRECLEFTSYEHNIYHHFKEGIVWFEDGDSRIHYINMNQVRNVIVTKIEG